MQVSWKKSVLVICKILGLFANTLTADDKYSLLNWDNLMQPIHTHLFKKQKTFCELFSSFLRSRLVLEHFQKKYDPRS